ncbi:L7Ae/L30e/S12e/Gadd45 family ribosomal protein [Angelakisella massiliensis]|uniref:L7Ae/L30e/S12e/Gadd45 family ribosomal protein n=1 Tax=Angelakisella massiliensis TaxID=1871018 RepID=UPI0008F961FC|nr:hypothetical protein [Angelakisella massiliensis]
MTNDRALGMLSICRKAGKLIFGFDAVKEAVAAGEARLILYAADLSEKTRASMDRVAARVEPAPPCVRTELTMYDFSLFCPKPAGVLAVTDEGLAKAVLKRITAEHEEE